MVVAAFQRVGHPSADEVVHVRVIVVTPGESPPTVVCSLGASSDETHVAPDDGLALRVIHVGALDTGDAAHVEAEFVNERREAVAAVSTPVGVLQREFG